MKGKTKSLSLQLTRFVFIDLMMCFLGGTVLYLIGTELLKQYSLSKAYELESPQLERYLLGFTIVISIVIFGVAFYLYIWSKLRYVRLLNEEIQAMEQGNLEQELTVRGQDEIAVLAENLEQMRHSFSKKIAQMEQIQKEQEHLVAELSHDMRTPLTALMMYLEFLKEKQELDEETLQNYVAKVYEKAECIKMMMDDLFFYYKMDQMKNNSLEQVPANALLYEFVSEIAMMLEQGGFVVEENLEVPSCSILFDGTYMGRIAGNVVSNIRKYADPAEPVQIHLRQEYALVHTAGSKVQVLTLMIRNRKRQIQNLQEKEENDAESMGLGLRSIRKMMEQMAGDMFCIEDQGEPANPAHWAIDDVCYYELCLLFRVTDTRKSGTM